MASSPHFRYTKRVMNGNFGSSVRAALGAILLFGAPLARAAARLVESELAGGPTATQGSEIDDEAPAHLTGTIYALGPGPKRVLFRFRRTASRIGVTIHILREYTAPDGSLAARERVVYEKGRLTAYEIEELQTGAKGRVIVAANRANNQQQKLL